jgi:hypothetical protein
MNEVCDMNQCPYPIASLKENKDKLIKIFEIERIFVFIFEISIQSKKHGRGQNPLVKIVHCFIGIKITSAFQRIVCNRLLNIKFI